MDLHAMPIETAAFRRETPGTDHVLHLNAAGAALPPRVVNDAVMRHLGREAEIGPHWAATAVRDELAAVRAGVAGLLQCAPHNIAFGDSAGRLWSMALLAMPLRPRARILVARSEWAGNLLNLFKLARTHAVDIEVMPVADDVGRIDVAGMADLIDDRTAAICLPAVASGCGVQQPLRQIAALDRPRDCLLFVDAAQLVGRMPVGLAEVGADVLVAPARKWLRGPRGQAIMALSDRALERLGDPPLLDQAGSAWTSAFGYTTRDDAARFETFEFSVAGRLGLGAAVAYARDSGVDRIATAIAPALHRLYAGLSAIPQVRVFEAVADAPAFLTFVADHVPAEQLNRDLVGHGICAATVLPAYARLDLAARGLPGVNRVAPHAYTSPDDIDRFITVVSHLLRR